MSIDHSKTYKELKIRNIPHILRKRELTKVVESAPKNIQSYADFGCSNGYLTNIFAKILGAKNSFGFDKSKNIEIAKINYPHISFSHLDLNETTKLDDKMDVITCFETLEHVGNTLSAIKTLREASSERSMILISVPIEIGLIGLIKFIIKRYLYRYPLSLNCWDLEYVSAILFKKDIGIYRNKSKGFGTHFGFNYKNIDKQLEEVFTGFKISKWSNVTSRFYKITCI